MRRPRSRRQLRRAVQVRPVRSATGDCRRPARTSTPRRQRECRANRIRARPANVRLAPPVARSPIDPKASESTMSAAAQPTSPPTRSTSSASGSRERSSELGVSDKPKSSGRDQMQSARGPQASGGGDRRRRLRPPQAHSRFPERHQGPITVMRLADRASSVWPMRALRSGVPQGTGHPTGCSAIRSSGWGGRVNAS